MVKTTHSPSKGKTNIFGQSKNHQRNNSNINLSKNADDNSNHNIHQLYHKEE